MTTATLTTTATLSPGEQMILDTMATPGILHSTRDLRRKIGKGMTRAAFDFLVLDLLDRGILWGDKHDAPAYLTAREKAELVPVETTTHLGAPQTTYYIGLGIRA